MLAAVEPQLEALVHQPFAIQPVGQPGLTEQIDGARCATRETAATLGASTDASGTCNSTGAVELAACALAIRDSVIPPTINLENPDEECDLDYTPNVAKEKKVRVAVNNSFGFGGHNATLVVAEFTG